MNCLDFLAVLYILVFCVFAVLFLGCLISMRKDGHRVCCFLFLIPASFCLYVALFILMFMEW